MAIFKDIESNALDYTILRDGGVYLYKREDFLLQDGDQLSKAGYELFHFACETWASEEEMHRILPETLSFPSYYGNNLDALDDVMSDFEVPAGGAALVLHRYDNFVRGAGKAHELAEVILDIFSRTSHEFLLTGKRFLTLVQSDDPHLRFRKLGGRAPGWNTREWLNKDRGL